MVRLHCCNLPVYNDALSKPDTWPVCLLGDEDDAQAHRHSLGTCHQVHSRHKKNRTCTQTNRFVLPWTPVEDPCCSTHSLDVVEASFTPSIVCRPLDGRVRRHRSVQELPSIRAVEAAHQNGLKKLWIKVSQVYAMAGSWCAASTARILGSSWTER